MTGKIVALLALTLVLIAPAFADPPIPKGKIVSAPKLKAPPPSLKKAGTPSQPGNINPPPNLLGSPAGGSSGQPSKHGAGHGGHHHSSTPANPNTNDPPNLLGPHGAANP